MHFRCLQLSSRHLCTCFMMQPLDFNTPSNKLFFFLTMWLSLLLHVRQKTKNCFVCATNLWPVHRAHWACWFHPCCWLLKNTCCWDSELSQDLVMGFIYVKTAGGKQGTICSPCPCWIRQEVLALKLQQERFRWDFWQNFPKARAVKDWGSSCEQTAHSWKFLTA